MKALSLSPWVRRFLIEYVVTERNLARSTQLSYRDTLASLIRYAAGKTHKRADLLNVEDLTRELITRFLSELSAQRDCCARTINQKLAALHTFARFVGEYGPEHLQWSGGVLAIPFRKYARPQISYLEKVEMDALLASPDRQTTQGTRDYATLLFLYNTGARASELAQLTVSDLQLDKSHKRNSFVTLHGKGDRTRICPLWPHTADVIESLVAGRSLRQHVFLNRSGQPMTRFGIHAVVERHAANAAHQLPSLNRKRVSPHTIRHTTATFLLRAGVDINTIRAWLGHVSLNTTNVYAQIDLEMKARALACLEQSNPSLRRRAMDSDLMQFLRSL
ncbi:site-specific integrase [Paraburkholderia sediminicola]|nr:site-specific integrase [Paraburkholderia sediminicola]